jgi:hypothetical protein
VDESATEMSDVQPLGYDARGRDPWLAVIRFTLLLGTLWGTLLVVEFAGYLLSTYEQTSTLTVQFLLGPQGAAEAGGRVGCLLFGALLLVSALECLKLRRRARKTFVACVVGGFFSMLGAELFHWYQAAEYWWYVITGPARLRSVGWTIMAIIRPMHLAIIPAALVYLMTRPSVKQRFD